MRFGNSAATPICRIALRPRSALAAIARSALTTWPISGSRCRCCTRRCGCARPARLSGDVPGSTSSSTGSGCRQVHWSSSGSARFSATRRCGPTRGRSTPTASRRTAQPDRWQYLPFGGGPRSCIGDHFAMLEATVGLATIVRAVEITSLDAEFPLAGAVHHGRGWADSGAGTASARPHPTMLYDQMVAERRLIPPHRTRPSHEIRGSSGASARRHAEEGDHTS